MSYPKPRQKGGELIRSVIGRFKENQISLPLDSHILIAFSGGPDSVALAHLLHKYGRRVVAPGRIALVHINHQWRAEASDEDERFANEFAKERNLSIICQKVAPPPKTKSWEAWGREQRFRVFEECLKQHGASSRVLTAHHADDQAETILWRILSGNFDPNGSGIAFQYGQILRPFLGVWKKDLMEFLREEGLTWREDSTNEEKRFLRVAIRNHILPLIEQSFPRAKQNLTDLTSGKSLRLDEELARSLQNELPYLLRKNHYHEILKRESPTGVSLPGGWRLSKDPSSDPLRE